MTIQSTVSVTEGKTKTGIFWRKSSTETSREVLVLVMGYAGSLRIWPATFVDRLAQKYVVITYDNRGTGMSIVPASPEEYSMQLMASDLDSVLQELQVEEIHLLGYSMGGCIALEYARCHQSKVKTLVLLSSTAAGRLYVKPPSEVSAALANPQGQTLWDIYMWTFQLMYSPEQLKRCEPQIRDIYEKSKHLPTSVRGLQGHSYAFKNFDGSDYLAGITVPVLIMSGKEDRLMPVANSENLARALSGSKLILVPDCEHALHVQEESLVIKEIEAHCV